MATTKTTGRQTTADSAVPQQADMTHSDSMDIVTPTTAGRSRKAVAVAAKPADVPVVTEEVSPQGKRRRRGALLLLILLLLSLLGYWSLRSFYHPAVAVDIQPPVPAPVAAAPPAITTPVPAAHTQAATPAAATPAVAAATAPAALTIVNPQPAAPPTNLLEVSVGTSLRGGLTMKFDRPVSWSVLGNDGQGNADVAVLGVRDLGTFPRNLPLPPGVKEIHAGILEPDTLRLRFTLVSGVRAVTAPADGPATTLTIFFRTAKEISAGFALPQTLQTTGGCGTAATPQAVKAKQLLQASLDKNPAYAEVRTALAMLASCGGDGARAERLLSGGITASGNAGLQMVAADAALRFASGDTDGALALLKANVSAAKGDAGYAELMADLQSAAK